PHDCFYVERVTAGERLPGLAIPGHFPEAVLVLGTEGKDFLGTRFFSRANIPGEDIEVFHRPIDERAKLFARILFDPGGEALIVRETLLFESQPDVAIAPLAGQNGR